MLTHVPTRNALQTQTKCYTRYGVVPMPDLPKRCVELAHFREQRTKALYGFVTRSGGEAADR
jgi:hypothetical protein